MCFLSVYRLKYLISIGIVVTLLIGIGLLYVLVYSFIISSVTIQVQSDFRTLLISIFLTTSLLMILSSLAAIYGLIRKKNALIVVYAVTMVLYFASFLTLAILIAVAPQSISSGCASGTPSDYNVTVNAGNALLCKDCECYYTNSEGYSEATLASMGISNFSLNDSSLPVNVQSCSQWSNETYPLTGQMYIIEMFFNCSGWCSKNSNPPYYLFSNINFGEPSATCVESITNFMKTFGYIILITSFTAAAFIFVILVVICCLCGHPDRKLKYDSLEIFKKPPIFVDEDKEESQITYS